MKLICFVSIFLINSVAGGKMRKLIDFFEKDAPNDIPQAPNYNEESLTFNRNKDFNPCRENADICANNGKCMHDNGNFYCVCPITHYGKTCEHVADQTNCEKNWCQNNSTCVSIKNHRTIVNTVLLRSLRRQKGQKDLTDKELAEIDLEVDYECICQKGYFGGLCDESLDDRQCQEVYCMGRGRGEINSTGQCQCECEKQYFGERCEQLSACYGVQCDNGGICEDVIDWENKTVSSKCNCPSTIEVIGGTATGENCETLQIPPSVLKELIPCADGRNSVTFFKRLVANIDIDKVFDDVAELEAISNDYHDGTNSKQKMASGWCQNGGKCVPEVVRVKSSRAYYIHRCECPDPLTDGYFCEYKRHDACSLTREEAARGARWDEKCTDSQHGACVDILGEATCVCKPDYTGEKCEVYDPCARQPCKHGDCIPIPTSAEVAFGTSRFQCLCPLSSKLDSETNDCLEIKENKCAPKVCGNGRCVSCESEIQGNDDLMPLCNAKEALQGFRCLCEAGYLPPYCKIHTNPCYQNLCQNSATCVVNVKQRSYECECLNGTRGSLCEFVDDSCDAFGSKICMHGSCVNDEYYHRGFSCECDEGYHGLDCDMKMLWSAVMHERFMKNYQVTLPLVACFFSLLILLPVILMGRRSWRTASGEAADSEFSKAETGTQRTSADAEKPS